MIVDDQEISSSIAEPDTLVSEVEGPEPLSSEIEFGGTAGPPGPSGNGMAVTDKIAAVALGGHRVVYLTTNDDLGYASVDDSSTIPTLLGITTGAVEAGVAPTVLVFGDMTEPGWSWTPGQPVYLGINGGLTQTPPVIGTTYILAVAITSTQIFVNPREPIALIQ